MSSNIGNTLGVTNPPAEPISAANVNTGAMVTVTPSRPPARHASTGGGIRNYRQSNEYWWQKPLVECGGQAQPAEVVVLREELQPGELGAWLNSRGVVSGVAELVRDQNGAYATRRISPPPFVSDLLRSLYAGSGLSRGAPDLVIWNAGTGTVRFAEIKCPHWDAPSTDQISFHRYIESAGSQVTVLEWEFVA